MSSHLGRRRLLRQYRQRRDVVNEQHQKNTPTETTTLINTQHTQHSSKQQRRQLQRRHQRGHDDINRYQTKDNNVGTRTAGQVQQTLQSWRNNGGNYNFNNLIPNVNIPNTINNESINGHIEYLCDQTNKITITPPVPIQNGPSRCKHKRKPINDKSDDKRQQKITSANNGQRPSRTKHHRYGDEANNVITFEHINVHGIHPHDQFIELTNAMGILDTANAGVYSLVETQWDTTSPAFKKYITSTIKKSDKYAQVEFSSNLEEKYDND